jgi:hypothetical protein
VTDSSKMSYSDRQQYNNTFNKSYSDRRQQDRLHKEGHLVADNKTQFIIVNPKIRNYCTNPTKIIYEIICHQNNSISQIKLPHFVKNIFLIKIN